MTDDIPPLPPANPSIMGGSSDDRLDMAEPKTSFERLLREPATGKVHDWPEISALIRPDIEEALVRSLVMPLPLSIGFGIIGTRTPPRKLTLRERLDPRRWRDWAPMRAWRRSRWPLVMDALLGRHDCGDEW